MYIEILEILQDIVDTYGDAGQIMFLGDFNATLPQQRELSRNWYKMRPFNKHSLLLYDFLCDNDLLVCNFDFRQNVLNILKAPIILILITVLCQFIQGSG